MLTNELIFQVLIYIIAFGFVDKSLITLILTENKKISFTYYYLLSHLMYLKNSHNTIYLCFKKIK